MIKAQPASWQDLMAFAFGVLKIAPDTFWAMTPREFDAAASPFLQANQTPERNSLAALMRQYPDK
jgi:uncharacterized phage protein (TIGR02216 family)